MPNRAPASNANGYGYLGYNNGPFHRSRRLRASPQHPRRWRCATTLRPLSDWAFSVAAKWQFSNFNIAGVYEKMEYEVAERRRVRSNKLKRNSFWAVDTTINVGANGQVFLFWGKASDGTGSAVNTPAPVFTANGITHLEHLARRRPGQGRQHRRHQWEVSYSYDLSKRTRVYTGYVKINNDSNANYNFNINSYNASAGGKPGGFVMGMYHNF